MDEWMYCPVCGAAFTQEEIDFQTCDACGWPDEDPEVDDLDLDDLDL